MKSPASAGLFLGTSGWAWAVAVAASAAPTPTLPRKRGRGLSGEAVGKTVAKTVGKTVSFVQAATRRSLPAAGGCEAMRWEYGGKTASFCTGRDASLPSPRAGEGWGGGQRRRGNPAVLSLPKQPASSAARAAVPRKRQVLVEAAAARRALVRAWACSLMASSFRPAAARRAPIAVRRRAAALGRIPHPPAGYRDD